MPNITGAQPVPPWHDDALCAQVGDDTLWFPELGKNISAEARAICHRCPVLEDCYAYAIDRPSLEGVWGGTSPRERGAIRRQRRQQAAA